ncbi:hypothetical protein RB12662 [Rhodopirellula baltica SH 1]|uniref:Uncharacterized protein n=1 Tax=Rhodopirellula baltica (strain DSM 10527 / NCIMB 13988 / SH1) TaxID=243090 RepID=Q7UIA3_RHOBA|nr:hypothetical protein RB12662 [Rhodopirellula baltica SH 1]
MARCGSGGDHSDERAAEGLASGCVGLRVRREMIVALEVGVRHAVAPRSHLAFQVRQARRTSEPTPLPHVSV